MHTFSENDEYKACTDLSNWKHEISIFWFYSDRKNWFPIPQL